MIGNTGSHYSAADDNDIGLFWHGWFSYRGVYCCGVFAMRTEYQPGRENASVECEGRPQGSVECEGRPQVSVGSEGRPQGYAPTMTTLRKRSHHHPAGHGRGVPLWSPFGFLVQGWN